MTVKKRLFSLFSLLAVLAAFALHYLLDPWGFYWKVSPEEANLRQNLVKTAQSYLGCQESDGSHRKIIDLYNAHQPLAMGYTVQYTDSWCATFVSAVAIQCDLTHLIPPECSCQRQISLFQDIGCWEEDESIIPLPGDLIYYDWDQTTPGDATGWADHVGIVVGTKWPFLKVIEGNKEDRVEYRILLLNDLHIRGYAKPDYASLLS